MTKEDILYSNYIIYQLSVAIETPEINNQSHFPLGGIGYMDQITPSCPIIIISKDRPFKSKSILMVDDY